MATAPAWHTVAVEPALAALDTDPARGLATPEARRRLERVGPNRVTRARDAPVWQLALRQFRSLVVLLLLAASVVAALRGEIPEALAILAALILNAGIGFATEWRARISLARLRALATPQALVRRDDRVRRIPAADVVPGDVLILETGAHIAADARLVESAGLRVTEATLTGESALVDKDATAVLQPDAPLAERRTLVYVGTAVVAGHGVAVVTATGGATELGRIATLVGAVGDRTTPLERQVEQLGRRLLLVALGVSALVGLAGILRGQPIGLMIETAITLAVAAVPEGLPAIVTIALAAGVWRLAHAGALVRRLPAVETLGSTTVICADKTGTMTENRMTVARLQLDGRTVVVEPASTPGGGGFREGERAIDPGADADVRRLLTVAALVNDANVEASPGACPDRDDRHGRGERGELPPAHAERRRARRRRRLRPSRHAAQGRTDIEARQGAYVDKWRVCLDSNADGIVGGIAEALRGTDVCVAFAAPGPGIIRPEWVKAMARDAIVFACANPVPEIWPWEAKEAGARIGDASETHGDDAILPRMDDWEAHALVAVAAGMAAQQQGIARRPRSREDLYEGAVRTMREAREAVAALMREGLIPEAPAA